MIDKNKFSILVQKHQPGFASVVPFNPLTDKLLTLDFSKNNKDLTDEIVNDTNLFSDYISSKIRKAGCRYGIGGYAEHRTVYSRSRHFDSLNGEEPRRLHLGVDIWGEANTAVIAPLDGIVHSFAFNNNFGDYGATIVLSHSIDGITFHSLYGHLSLNSLNNLQEGQLIKCGEVFAEFGVQFENGQWPPHLHLQLIIDMGGRKGDYPGVCKFSEMDQYILNSPDPALLLPFFQ
ncbi:MAG: peptidoglycan DD-metalloendopeptidase family protein [Bacteroidetes bacterium]|nr:peptidoglycan DD-metalloendopeptidase family protein [Bacteroidota bacterium]